MITGRLGSLRGARRTDGEAVGGRGATGGREILLLRGEGLVGTETGLCGGGLGRFTWGPKKVRLMWRCSL